jgi:hypothetical protein
VQVEHSVLLSHRRAAQRYQASPPLRHYRQAPAGATHGGTVAAQTEGCVEIIGAARVRRQPGERGACGESGRRKITRGSQAASAPAPRACPAAEKSRHPQPIAEPSHFMSTRTGLSLPLADEGAGAPSWLPDVGHEQPMLALAKEIN